jgi:hypothetical protein
MWTYEHSIETDAAAEAVYALYADVPNWTRWDAGIVEVTIDGPFAAGTTGTLTPEGQGALPYTLIEVRPGRGFADETAFGDITLRFDHNLEPLAAGGTRITHGVTVTGPGAEEVGPMVVADLPQAMEALARLALESTTPRVG